MASIGGGKIKVWSSDSWTSQWLDVSFKRGTTNLWATIKWQEFNTTNEDEAYVRVSILSTAGTTLFSGIIGDEDPSRNSGKLINLSLDYPTTVNQDIYVKFTLYGSTKNPIVKNIEVR